MVEVIPRIKTQILEIPTSLVLFGKTYQITIQIQNTGPIAGNFKIQYEATGIQIKSSKLMNRDLSMLPNSSETDNIEFIPTQKGLISLELKVIYIREVIKEVTRSIETPHQPSPLSPSIKPPQSTNGEITNILPPEIQTSESEIINLTDSVIKDTFSPEISDILEDIFNEPDVKDEISLPPSLSPQPEPQKIVEKIKEIVEDQIYSTYIYLNALDKESSTQLKQFAKKGDSNILTSEMGLPLCICYFYSENQMSKWKIRPALIRDICIRMKEKFGKFSYYISYPLPQQFDEEEIPIIQEAIRTFVLPHSSSSNPMLILNLDIIPELEKPSIIIGYEKNGIYEHVRSLLTDIFGNSIDIFIDDCVFSGGLLYNQLTNWTGPSQARVLNMVLSNNFISNISLFQNLLESLASLALGEI
jgi:hypothetical protein